MLATIRMRLIYQELKLGTQRLYTLFKARKESAMPRELIDTGTDKRYVRRDSKGQFKESDDVGRSSAQDQKRDSKTKPRKGEGDKGDR
jgi:hypothetical protein